MSRGAPRWLDAWLKIHSSPEGYRYVRWYLDNNEYMDISASADRSQYTVVIDGIMVWQQEYYDLSATVARQAIEGGQ